MLYNLSLERLARDEAPRSTADIESLLRAGADHPEHLAELLLGGLGSGGLGETLEDRARLLQHLDALDLGDAEGRLDLPIRQAFEDFLIEALRVRAPEELSAMQAPLRRWFCRGHATGATVDHLRRLLDAGMEAARAGDAYLFHALTRYVARRLPQADARARAVLGEFLGLYQAVQAMHRGSRWREWYPPLLRTMSVALQSEVVQHLLTRDPDLLAPCLEPLALDLATLAATSDEERLDPLCRHLASVMAALPDHPEVLRLRAALPKALTLLPGGVSGALARELASLMSLHLYQDQAGVSPWPSLGERIESLSDDVARRRQVRAALRPRPRHHLGRYLQLAESHGAQAPNLAALYAPDDRFPLPLVALYFPRGSRKVMSDLARGPLDIYLRKLGSTYRVVAFHQNRSELIPCHGFVDEAATLPFRRALTYSGGRYALAMVELETLHITSLRTYDGYLDFTGAYYRGIERLIALDYPGAKSDLEKALAANPRLAGAQIHLGRCYRKLARGRRDLDRARRSYERELSNHPDSADALNNLGLLTLSEGDLEGAVALLERAIQAVPDHLGALRNRALTCVALANAPGNRERFGQLLRNIRDLTPGGTTVARLLAEEDGVFGVDWQADLRLVP